MTKPEALPELLALAERCEKAEGPDTALDLEIRQALGLPWKADRDRYTASLDAAMTLVPEGCSWNLHKHSRWARAGVFVDDGRDPGHYCDAVSPALALTAAALRSKAKDHSGGGE